MDKTERGKILTIKIKQMLIISADEDPFLLNSFLQTIDSPSPIVTVA